MSSWLIRWMRSSSFWLVTTSEVWLEEEWLLGWWWERLDDDDSSCCFFYWPTWHCYFVAIYFRLSNDDKNGNNNNIVWMWCVIPSIWRRKQKYCDRVHTRRNAVGTPKTAFSTCTFRRRTSTSIHVEHCISIVRACPRSSSLIPFSYYYYFSSSFWSLLAPSDGFLPPRQVYRQYPPKYIVFFGGWCVVSLNLKNIYIMNPFVVEQS